TRRHKPAGVQLEPTLPLTTGQPVTPGRRYGAALSPKRKKRVPRKPLLRRRIHLAMFSSFPETRSQPGKLPGHNSLPQKSHTTHECKQPLKGPQSQVPIPTGTNGTGEMGIVKTWGWWSAEAWDWNPSISWDSVQSMTGVG
ncbi:Hypothetical predicted protein, partial [Pelobates cultripes]